MLDPTDRKILEDAERLIRKLADTLVENAYRAGSATDRRRTYEYGMKLTQTGIDIYNIKESIDEILTTLWTK